MQSHGLLTEPEFAWWVPHSLKKRERIISKLSTPKYWRTQEKLGITVPRSIEQAYKLDEENNNTLWQDAVAKEIRHVLPAFSDPGISIDEVKKQLIGILWWGCELGRLDILHEVALMSAFNTAPRQGHLDAVYHTFSYLNTSGPCSLFFDPTELVFDVKFNDNDEWKELYEIEEEPTPSDMPKPRGKSIVMTCWVDAFHASKKLAMRSHTGIFIELNGAPVAWYSKRQNTVESSTFGLEFVALRVATEMCQALRYKLRMFGVAIDGPTSVMCDNKSVQTNALVPTSQLGKKHNAICYHKVRENVAAGVIRVGWVNSEDNLADLFTKVLNLPTRVRLLSKMMSRWSKAGKW